MLLISKWNPRKHLVHLGCSKALRTLSSGSVGCKLIVFFLGDVDLQVLFFEQVRSAATGGYGVSNMPSNIRALMRQDSGDDRSCSDVHTENVPSVSASAEGCYVLHQDFSTLKDELVNLKSRITEAENRTSFAHDSMKPAKRKGLFFKPKKFLLKLFNKKVSNSASSKDKDSETLSVRESTMLRRRHSMTWAMQLPNVIVLSIKLHQQRGQLAMAWSSTLQKRSASINHMLSRIPLQSLNKKWSWVFCSTMIFLLISTTSNGCWKVFRPRCWRPMKQSILQLGHWKILPPISSMSSRSAVEQIVAEQWNEMSYQSNRTTIERERSADEGDELWLIEFQCIDFNLFYLLLLQVFLYYLYYTVSILCVGS